MSRTKLQHRSCGRMYASQLNTSMPVNGRRKLAGSDSSTTRNTRRSRMRERRHVVDGDDDHGAAEEARGDQRRAEAARADAPALLLGLEVAHAAEHGDG